MTTTRRNIEITIFSGVVLCALYFGSVVQRGGSRSEYCQSNLKQIGLGLKQYERDYDEKTVLSGNWEKALSPWLKNDALFACPSGNNYALNSYISGVSHQQITDYTGTPTVFDSLSTRPNAADFGISYADGAHEIWRRGRGTNVLFFDGHVKWMQQKPVFRAIKSLSVPKPSKKATKTRAAR